MLACKYLWTIILQNRKMKQDEELEEGQIAMSI